MKNGGEAVVDEREEEEDKEQNGRETLSLFGCLSIPSANDYTITAWTGGVDGE